MILPYQGKHPYVPKSCFIADNTVIIGDVELGESTSVWFGTVIRGDVHFIRIGSRTNIQDNSTVHVTSAVAPTVVGSEVTVGHNAVIHGCTIDDHCLIGMGAIIMDNAVIGSGSVIGAGALISPGTIIPPRSLCVGLPAKIVRNVSDDEFESILHSAKHYVDASRNYLDSSNNHKR